MAATKLQINWASVGFTPTGGSLTPLTKITDITIAFGGQVVDFAGDTDRYTTTAANVMNKPKVTIKTGDIGGMLGFPVGTFGAISATHKDAKNASGGDIVYAIANAVVQDIQAAGPHAQFGSGTLSFDLFSTDGTTSPIAFTRV